MPISEVKMNIRLMFLLLTAAAGLVFGPKILAAEPNVRDVIMLLDSNVESVYNPHGGINLKTFNAALDYGKCSIIVSAPILHAWFEHIDTISAYNDAQKELISQIASLEFESLRSKMQLELTSTTGEIMKLLFSKSPLETNKESNEKIDAEIVVIQNQRKQLEEQVLLMSNMSEKVKFSACYCFVRKDKLKMFDIYKCLNTSEYLLVPKRISSKSVTASVTASFKIKDSKLLMPLSMNQLKNDLQSWGQSSLHNSSWKMLRGIGGLIDKGRFFSWSLFNKVHWDKLKNIFIPAAEGWIFYIGGHGMYTPQRIQQKMRLCPMKTEFLTDLHNVAPFFAQIAGLKAKDHKDMLAFLGSTIKSDVVYVTTCFGGGYHNQESVKHIQKLQESDKNFVPYILVNGSITDAVTYGPSSPADYFFGLFFTQLRNLKKDMKENKESNEIELLSHAVAEVTVSNRKSALRTPTCLMPHAKEAIVIGNRDNVCMIRDQNKIKVLGQKGLLFFSDSIGNIEIESYKELPLFISMKVGNALHIIESLNTQIPLNKLLQESFYDFWEVSKKVYVIKTLQAANYENSGFKADEELNLQDVIIVKDRSMKAYGFFTTDCKITGIVYAKHDGKFFKAKVDGSYQDHVPATIGTFTLIDKSEFEKAKTAYIN